MSPQAPAHDCYDVAIIGSGLVGASLGCALQGLDLRVLQVEAQPPRATAPAWDERNLALARRSVQALQAFGVWRHAAAEAQPIRSVHVTRRGDFGAVRIHAEEYGFEALGHTVPARALGAALEARLGELSDLTRLAPARLDAITVGRDSIALTLQHDGASRVVHTRLLVGADGTESSVRAMSGIETSRRDYAQTAIVTTLEPAREHAQVAYERFTDTGPFALLPLAQGRCGLVWTVSRDEAESILALEDAAFLQAAGERFGSRLGGFRRVGRRQPWPLHSVLAQQLTAPRTVLLGNAAQTIHPIGAQGFNLGVRDVLGLCEMLKDSARRGVDPGDAANLAHYAAARRADRDATTQWSDAMVRWFAPEGELMRLVRGAGLVALERLPRLKRELAYAMMGYRDAAA